MRRPQVLNRHRPRSLNRGVSDFLKLKTAQLGGARVPPFYNWGIQGFMPKQYAGQAAGILLDGRIVVTAGQKYFDDTFDVSDDTWVFAASGLTHSAAAPFPNPGFNFASATLGDGRLLVCGGGGGNPAQTLDPGLLTWTVQPPMAAGLQYGFTLTTLQNGNALRVGGADGFTALTSVEEFDFGSNTWITRGSLLQARVGHSAVLLSNGKVMVSGGINTFANTEIYDPVTHTWSTTANQPQATNLGIGMATLDNGKTLLVYSVFSGFLFNVVGDLYDPATGLFTPTSILTGSFQSGISTVQFQYVFDVGGGYAAMVNTFGPISRVSFYDYRKDLWFEKGATYPEAFWMVGEVLLHLRKNTFFALGNNQEFNVLPHRVGRYVLISTFPTNDQIPPTFGGLMSVEPGVSTDRLVLHWAAASDLRTHPEDINYFVYPANSPGGETFGPMGFEYAKTSAWAGSTAIELLNLSPDTDYWFVVRARDMLFNETNPDEFTQSGNLDPNTVEVFFHTPLAIAAPTFAWAETDPMSQPRSGLKILRLGTSQLFANGHVDRFMTLMGTSLGGSFVDADGDIYTLEGERESRVTDVNEFRVDFAVVDGNPDINDGSETRRGAILGGNSGGASSNVQRYWPYLRRWESNDFSHPSLPPMQEGVSQHAAAGIAANELLRIGGLTTADDTTTATNTVERMSYIYSYIFGYNNLVTAFTVGQTLSGASVGTIGTIIAIFPDGPTTGRIYISQSSIVGFPSIDELITDGAGGSAVSTGFFGSQVYSTWFFVDSLDEKRFNHSAIELTSGKILVAGGYTADIGGSYWPIRNLQIFDPSTNTWQLIRAFRVDYSGQTINFAPNNYIAGATSFAVGRVEVDSHGAGPPFTGIFQYSYPYDNKSATSPPAFQAGEQLSDINFPYDLTSIGGTGFFSNGDTITGDISGATATIIGIPQVEFSFLTGYLVLFNVVGSFSTGETFTTGNGTTGTLQFAVTGGGDGVVDAYVERIRAHSGRPPLVKLLDDRVMIIGGNDTGGNDFVDIFDPSDASNPVHATDLPSTRIDHTAHRFGDGQVGVFGGSISGTATDKVHLYDPGLDTWTAKASMLHKRKRHASCLLPNNTVLVAGGTDETDTILDSVELSNT